MPPPATPPPPINTAPALSSALESNCFNFPSEPFTPANSTAWETVADANLGLLPGELAVEFTLTDTDGNDVSLSELLKTKPVWLQLGSYTCPVYQLASDALDVLVAEGNAAGPYADQVHFVHVYTVEAHPNVHASPTAYDNSPYSGKKKVLEFSTLFNPLTYADRQSNAAQMKAKLGASQTLLVDDLAPRPTNNPVWCTYGKCPACSFLIGRDGIVREVLDRTPASPADLEAPLEYLLSFP